jgi:uncharacterized protein (DUF1330 family)
MAAYIIAGVKVTDPVQYEHYRKWASQAIDTHRAKILVRGGACEGLEGREPGRIVVLEFEDLTHARSFYHSQEYTRAREARANAAVMNLLIVEGI